MTENSAFLVLIRRLLTAALIIALLLLYIYLGLARYNRANSYQRGLAAIEQAREFWPMLVADIETLRSNIAAEYTNKDASLLDNQRFINALDLLTIKQRERIVLAAGVKVSVYARVYVRTKNVYLIPIPGNTNPLNNDVGSWPAATAEVVAAQQDMLLSDFIASDVEPVWMLDPLEREARLNTNPGVISWALLVNAPGGYEQALAWVSQLLLMLCSFLLLFVPAYVWHDARGRYRWALLWTTTVALTNVCGLLAYLLFGRIPAATCQECRQAVNSQQKFCPYCRTSLKSECNNCGKPMEQQWRYCAGCGTKPQYQCQP
ncbi:MAG: zinc ribbon domain-containing protein [Acidobacteriota bacterium]